MKSKVLCGLLLGFVAMLAVQSCTKVKGQEPSAKVVLVQNDQVVGMDSAVLTETKSQVPIRILLPNNDDSVSPIFLKAPASASDLELRVVFSNPETASSFGKWLSANWVSLSAVLLFLIQVFVNMSPSTSDNSIFLILKKVFDTFFPNRNVSGGTHP